jgi:hypothetical protein
MIIWLTKYAVFVGTISSRINICYKIKTIGQRDLFWIESLVYSFHAKKERVKDVKFKKKCDFQGSRKSKTIISTITLSQISTLKVSY